MDFSEVRQFTDVFASSPQKSGKKSRKNRRDHKRRVADALDNQWIGLQQLENRLLMAFSIADFFPLPASQAGQPASASWTYLGASSQGTIAPTITATSGGTINGVPTTKLTTTIIDTDETVTMRAYYSNFATGGPGLTLQRLEYVFDDKTAANDDYTLILNPTGGLNLITTDQPDTGNVFPTGAVAVTGTLANKGVTNTIAGTITGNTTIGALSAPQATVLGNVALQAVSSLWQISLTPVEGTAKWTTYTADLTSDWQLLGNSGTNTFDDYGIVNQTLTTNTTLGHTAPNGGNTAESDTYVSTLTSTTIAKPEINIQQAGITVADEDLISTDSQQDFGSLAVTDETTQSVKVYTIQNLGTSALILSGSLRISIGGANAGDFTLLTQPDQVIPVGGSQTFSIRFNPTAAGLRTATVSIVNNDGGDGINETTYNFAIQGTGIALFPEIDVFGLVGSNDGSQIVATESPVVDGDTTPSKFDNTDFGAFRVLDDVGSPILRTFTIRNNGDGNLNFSGTPRIKISGSNAADFTVLAQPNAVLAPGDSVNFTIQFNPSAVGVRNATVTILTDDSNEATYDFAIRGTGVTTAVNANDATLEIGVITAGGGAAVGAGTYSAFRFTTYTADGVYSTSGDGNVVGRTLAFAPTATDFGLLGMKVGEKRLLIQRDFGTGLVSTITEAELLEINPFEVRGGPSQNVLIVNGDSTPSTTDLTNMGVVTTGQAIVRQFTIHRNSPNAIGYLAGGVVTIGGPDAGKFTTTQPLASVNGLDFTFNVTFHSTVAGFANATVELNFGNGVDPYVFDITAVASNSQVNTAPTLTTISTLALNAVEQLPVEISYEALAAAANELDIDGNPIVFRIESLLPNTFQLTKSGVAVVPGTTTLAVGESLLWTPTAGSNGAVSAFNVRAVDDANLASLNPVVVKIQTTLKPVITVAANDNTANELAGGTAAARGQFTITRTGGATALPLQVNFSITGSATSGLDYVPVNNFVVFAAGQTSVTININAIDDGLPEPLQPALPQAETVVLTLQAGTDYNTGAAGSATINIVDSTSTVTITGDDTSSSETGGRVFVNNFTGGTDSAAAQAIIALLSSPVDGQTITLVDFAGVSRKFEFNVTGGVGAGNIAVTVGGDLGITAFNLRTAIEGAGFGVIGESETFTVVQASVGTAGNRTNSQSTGVDYGQFTITRTPDNSVLLRDDFASSLDATRWTRTGGTLGQTEFSSTNNVSIVNGAARLQLSTFNPNNPGVSFLGSQIASTQMFAVGEGLFFETRFRLVGPAGNLPNGLVASFSAFGSNGSLHDGLDMQLATTQTGTGLVITSAANSAVASDVGDKQLVTTAAPGLDLTQFVTVTMEWTPTSVRYYINGELVRENVTTVPDEPMGVRLNFFVPDSSLTEAFDGDLHPASNNVNNQNFFADVDYVQVSRPFQVNLSIAGTASIDDDYLLELNDGNTTRILPQGTTSIAMPVGKSSVKLRVIPVDDALAEATESVTLSILPGNYNLGTIAEQSSTVSITDNEPTVTLTVTDANASETGGGTSSGRGTVTFSRSGGDTSAPLTVNYTVTGTATNGTDYTQIANSVTFGAGQTTITVNVDPIDDTEGEANETVIFTLSADSAYKLGTPAQQVATIVIADNEPTVTIAATDATATETNGGTPAARGQFTITRSNSPVTAALAVNFTVPTSITVNFSTNPIDGDTISFTDNLGISHNFEFDNNAIISNAGFTGIGIGATATVTGNNLIAALQAVGFITLGSGVSFSIFQPAQGTLGNLTGSTTSTNISLINGPTRDVDYTINLADGTLVTGNTVFIAAGQTTVVLNINPIDDILPEGTETMVLSLATDASYKLGAAATQNAAVNIVDNEPVVTVAASDSTATEQGAGTPAAKGVFTFTRTGGNLAQELTIAYSVVTVGTSVATPGIDYLTLPGTVTFAAGSATATVNVDPLDDLIAEGNELVTVIVTPGSTYGLGAAGSERATVTIADNEPTVFITATDPLAQEQGATLPPLDVNLATIGTFTLTRSGGSSSLPLSVTIIVGGTATGGPDYEAIVDEDLVASGTQIIFAANQTTRTINIRPFDDTVGDRDPLNNSADEFVLLTIQGGNSTYNVGGTGNATVTITDNEPVVVVTASDPSAAEIAGAAFGSPTARGTYTITRSGGDLTQALSVDYVISGSAVASVDYDSTPFLSGTVTFAAGITSIVLPVNPFDDVLAEGAEDVVLTLTKLAAYNLGTAAQQSATITIADNEPTVTITASDPTANESSAGTVAGQGTFTVTRTGGNISSPLTVTYVLGGSALLGVDYVALPDEDPATDGLQIILAAGQSTRVVVINPIQDVVADANETIVMILQASPSNAYALGSAAQQTATISIVDDEPTVSVIASDPIATEAGAGTAASRGMFTFKRTGGNLSQSLTLTYLAVGSATPGADYTPLPGVVVFPPNVTSIDVPVNTLQDQLADPNETVVVTLVPQVNYNIVGDAQPLPLVTLVASDATANETSAGTVAGRGVFTFTRTGGDISQALELTYLVGGSAVAGTDFTAFIDEDATLAGIQIIFAAGQSTRTIDVNPIFDTAVESDKTVVLSMTSSPLTSVNDSYVLGLPTQQVATVTILDNEPVVSIVATDPVADETGGGAAAGRGSFVISRVGGNIAQALQVLVTISGTAIRDANANGALNGNDDYSLQINGINVPLTNIIIIPANASSVTVDLDPFNDAVVEGDETATITIASSANYNISPIQATDTITISDDEPVVTISNIDAASAEVNTGTAAATGSFRLNRIAGDVSAAMTVTLNVAGTAVASNNATADAGEDYVLRLGSATGTVINNITRASATVNVNNNPTDGLTMALTDSRGVQHVFEFDNNASVTAGRIAVTIGVDNIATTTNLQNAFIAEGFTINAGGPTDFVVNQTHVGGSGNQLNYVGSNATTFVAVSNFTGGGNFTVTFTGGVSGDPGVDTLFVFLVPLDETDALPQLTKVGEGRETAIFNVVADSVGGIDYTPAATGATATINVDDNEAVVTVQTANTASDNVTREVDTANRGVIRLTRANSTTQALTVNFGMLGSGIRGVDYVLKVIPANMDTTTANDIPVTFATGVTPDVGAANLQVLNTNFVTFAANVTTIDIFVEAIDDANVTVTDFAGGAAAVQGTSTVTVVTNPLDGQFITLRNTAGTAFVYEFDAATATIGVAANPTDAQTITLVDSTGTSHVFEFNVTGGVTLGNIQVNVGANATATGNNLIAAIRANGFNVVGSGMGFSVLQTASGAAGNQTNSSTAPNVVVSNFTGGGVSAGNIAVTIGGGVDNAAQIAATTTNLSAAITGSAAFNISASTTNTLTVQQLLVGTVGNRFNGAVANTGGTVLAEGGETVFLVLAQGAGYSNRNFNNLTTVTNTVGTVLIQDNETAVLGSGTYTTSTGALANNPVGDATSLENGGIVQPSNTAAANPGAVIISGGTGAFVTGNGVQVFFNTTGTAVRSLDEVQDPGEDYVLRLADGTLVSGNSVTFSSFLTLEDFTGGSGGSKATAAVTINQNPIEELNTTTGNLDGMFITLRNSANTAIVYEFDSAAVNATASATINTNPADGHSITLLDALGNPHVFEFDQAATSATSTVRIINNPIDTATVTLRNSANTATIFEFDGAYAKSTTTVTGTPVDASTITYVDNNGVGHLFEYDVAAVKATALLTVTGTPADGATITLTDATGTARIFEYNSAGGVTGGNIAVTVGANNNITALNLNTAINGSGFFTSTLAGTNVTVTQTTFGTAGNQTNSSSGTVNTTVNNFTGGVNGTSVATASVAIGTNPVDGDSITLVDATGTSKTFEFDSNNSVSGLNVRIIIGANATTTGNSLITAITAQGFTVTGTGASFTVNSALSGAVVGGTAGNRTNSSSTASVTVGNFTGGASTLVNGGATAILINASTNTTAANLLAAAKTQGFFGTVTGATVTLSNLQIGTSGNRINTTSGTVNTTVGIFNGGVNPSTAATAAITVNSNTFTDGETFTLMEIGSAATAAITIGTNPSDTQFITLVDSTGTSRNFEFDNNASVTGGNVSVTIGGTAALTLDNLLAAINSSGFGFFATISGTTLTVSQSTAGAAGNRTNSSSTANVTVANFAGGADGVAHTFEFDTNSSVGTNRRAISIGVDTTATGNNIIAALAAEGFTVNGSGAAFSVVQGAYGKPMGGRAGNTVNFNAAASLSVANFTGGTDGLSTANAPILMLANPTDGQIITLVDGTGTNRVFEFDNNASVTAGRTLVTIGANAAATGDNLRTAINGTAFGFVAAGSGVDLLVTQSVAGTNGNRTNTGLANVVTVGNFTGGANVVTTGNIPVTVGGDQIATAANLMAVVKTRGGVTTGVNFTGSVILGTTGLADTLRLISNIGGTAGNRTNATSNAANVSVTNFASGAADGSITSRAGISITTNPTDGQNIVLLDNLGASHIFEFDNDNSITQGNVRVAIGANVNATGLNLINAINSEGFVVVGSGANFSVFQLGTGAAVTNVTTLTGNRTNVNNTAGNLTVGNFASGASVLTSTRPTVGGLPAANAVIGVLIGANATETAANLALAARAVLFGATSASNVTTFTQTQAGTNGNRTNTNNSATGVTLTNFINGAQNTTAGRIPVKIGSDETVTGNNLIQAIRSNPLNVTSGTAPNQIITYTYWFVNGRDDSFVIQQTANSATNRTNTNNTTNTSGIALVIHPFDDTVIENQSVLENVTISLVSNPGGGLSDSTTNYFVSNITNNPPTFANGTTGLNNIRQNVTIADNDPNPGTTVTLAVADATAIEGPVLSPIDIARYTISRNLESLAGDVTFTFTLSGTATRDANGTADVGEDYRLIVDDGVNAPFTLIGNTVTILAGRQSVDIRVVPIDESDTGGANVAEGTETVVLTVDASANYTLGTTSSGSINLLDNEATISVQAVDAFALETPAGGLVDRGILLLSHNLKAAATVTVGTNPVDGNSIVLRDTNGNVSTARTFEFDAATATISLSGNPTDAQTLTLLDTSGFAHVFEFDNNASVSGTNIQVTIGGNAAATGDALITAITGAGFHVQGSGASFSVLQAATGTAGNRTNSTTSGVITVSDFTGGGVTSGAIAVAIGADALASAVNLRAALNASGFFAASGTTTATTVQQLFSGSTGIQTNSTNNANVTVTDFGTPQITVTYTLTGTASSGIDYTSLPDDDAGTVGLQLTFAANQVSRLLNVDPIDDVLNDPNETVIFNIVADAAYSVDTVNSSALVLITDIKQSAVVTIVDDEPIVTMVVSDSNANESGAGDVTGRGVYTLTRSGGNVSDPLTVNFSVSGTGTRATDYNITLANGSVVGGTTSGQVTFASGQTTLTLIIDPIQDTEAENPELVTLSLVPNLGPANAYSTTAGKDSGTVTIIDDEPTVVLFTTDATASETNGATTGRGIFTIARVGGSTDNPLDVDFSVSGTGIIDSDGVIDLTDDYQLFSVIDNVSTQLFPVLGQVTVTIPVGATSVVIEARPLDDSVADDGDTVILTLAATTEYRLGNAVQQTGTVTIADNEPFVFVSASDPSATETGGGTAAGRGVFTFTRTGSTVGNLVVNYTISGSALNGIDYTTIPLTVTIPDGSSSVTVNIDPIDDVTIEETETAIVTISSSANYNLGTASQRTATVTIADNEPTVSVVATKPAASETDGGSTGKGVFVISRIGGSSLAALTVNFTLGGLAVNGTDYQTVVQQAVIAAGQSSVTVEIKPIDDTDIDVADFSAETVVLSLSDGAYRIDPVANAATVNISDNEAPIDYMGQIGTLLNMLDDLVQPVLGQVSGTFTSNTGRSGTYTYTPSLTVNSRSTLTLSLLGAPPDTGTVTLNFIIARPGTLNLKQIQFMAVSTADRAGSFNATVSSKGANAFNGFFRLL